jgi:hypothetical protein
LADRTANLCFKPDRAANLWHGRSLIPTEYFTSIYFRGHGGLRQMIARRNVGTVTAAEIIEEIKHLPAVERAAVASFVRSDDSVTRLSSTELGQLAESLAQLEDPAQSEDLEERIVAGFYGKA